MNELAMQKLLVDAANARGGFGHKLSNRFLVGVPDLLIKMPLWYSAAIIEVKRTDYSRPEETFKLDVTQPQKNFLRRANKAGIPAGVASFIQHPKHGVKSLWLAIYTFKMMERSNYIADFGHHNALGDNNRRVDSIISELDQFYQDWEE